VTERPVDRVIHEPSRLRLVTLLLVVEEADFVYIADQTGLTAGNISSHMSKLEQAGYVDVDKTFVDRRPRTVYRLTDAGRNAINDYRDTLEALLRPIGRSS
jgi:DNA-binding MarR family transcriptional regulator